jgi:hypothetical protein
MATTENTFNGNGSNLGPFTFTFQWLEPTDIVVSVDGIQKTAGLQYNLQALNYATRSGGEVLFTAGNAPAVGTGNIRIYRVTSGDTPTSTFLSGSAIRAQDLNENFLQSLYIAQETQATTVTASTGNLVDGAITSAKLASEAVTEPKIGPSAVTTTKIQNGAVTSAKLAETYLTTTAATNTYLTSATAATTYLPLFTVTTTGTNRSIVNHERCTVTASGITITLPASPQPGWEVTIATAGTFTDTIIARNGTNIMGLAEDMTLNLPNYSVTLFYVDATRGWRII